ncbi:hypothetical protein WN943_015512 [Citrus x changshan-huyou]
MKKLSRVERRFQEVANISGWELKDRNFQTLWEVLLDGTERDNFKQGAAVEASFGRNCKLPASIERLSGLVLLNLKDWKNLESLPSTINVTANSSDGVNITLAAQGKDY